MIITFSLGLKAVTLHEAKILLKDDDDLITAVYDYWLNKRLRLERALIPQVGEFLLIPGGIFVICVPHPILDVNY